MQSKRILMGPGPSESYPEVLDAMSRPTIGHLDPLFLCLMDDLNRLLRDVYKTKNSVTLPISGTGSAGMECCLVNLLEPNDKIIVAVNGIFGQRIVEIAKRCRAIPVVIEFEWGAPIDPARIKDELRCQPDIVAAAFVHAETSTGVRSDIETLVALTKQYGCLSIVDAVTSLGGMELQVDEWGIDAIYSGTQKCLSAPPGLSPVSFSDDAMNRIRRRALRPQSWYLDLNLLTEYWGSNAKRTYHHTAPINMLYGLHAALSRLTNEGVENAWRRHLDVHTTLAKGIEDLGLQFLVDPKYRLPQLNVVKVPVGVDEAAVRKALLDTYDIEIGGGLGPLAGKIWRIGLMGASCSTEYANACISALSDISNDVAGWHR